MSVAELPDIELSDHELFARGRAGDREALQVLVGRHAGTVTAVCRSRLRPSEVADAEQETFLRALSSLDQLRDPERFGAWLRAIASRVCTDVHRTRRRRHLVPLDDDGLLPDSAMADDDLGPDEQLERHDEARHLHVRLGGLSDRDRRALWMRDALGIPVPEVAADLGVTEGSARVLLTRARHRLRSAYGSLIGLLLPALRPWRRPDAAQVSMVWAPSAHAALIVAAVVGGTVAGASTAAAVGTPAGPRTNVAAVALAASASSGHDAALAGAVRDAAAGDATPSAAADTDRHDHERPLLGVTDTPPDDQGARTGATVGDESAGASLYGLDPENLADWTVMVAERVEKVVPSAAAPPLP